MSLDNASLYSRSSLMDCARIINSVHAVAESPSARPLRAVAAGLSPASGGTFLERVTLSPFPQVARLTSARSDSALPPGRNVTASHFYLGFIARAFKAVRADLKRGGRG